MIEQENTMKTPNKIKWICALLLVVGISSQVNAKFVSITESAMAATDTAEVYNIVDTMPEIVGGLSSLYDKIVYPDLAMKSGVEGRVFVRFIVDENGEVTNPEILKDIGAGCGNAAVKALEPVKFTQAKLNGEVVKVYYTLPITFKISK